MNWAILVLVLVALGLSVAIWLKVKDKGESYVSPTCANYQYPCAQDSDINGTKHVGVWKQGKSNTNCDASGSTTEDVISPTFTMNKDGTWTNSFGAKGPVPILNGQGGPGTWKLYASFNSSNEGGIPPKGATKSIQLTPSTNSTNPFPQDNLGIGKFVQCFFSNPDHYDGNYYGAVYLYQ